MSQRQDPHPPTPIGKSPAAKTDRADDPAGGRTFRSSGPMPRRLSLLGPSATVFVSSMCIMILELVAGRLIARYLGSSLYTWTAVIGVVLLGITIGNYLGGRLADKYAAHRTLALIFLAASASCVTTVVLNNLVARWEFLTYLSWPVRTFAHVTLVFLLPSLLLGMISPVVAKMALECGLATGRTVGSIYAWGAAGSILGTFVAGYYLIAQFGTVQIVWGVAGALLLMALLYQARLWINYLWVAALGGAAVLGLGPWAWARQAGAALALRGAPTSDVVYEDDGEYCHIRVRRQSRQPDIRTFVQDTLIHSWVNMNDPNDLRYFYSQVYAAVTRGLRPPGTPIATLTIGGGGYVFPRYLAAHWPGSRVEVAEIDPAVTRAAIAAFGLSPDAPIRTIQLDGRNYVDELQRRRHGGEPTPVYDFIYEDAINGFTVPYQLTTQEFDKMVAALLAEDGAYLVNVVEIYEHGYFLGALLNTLERTFAHVEVLAAADDRHQLYSWTTFVLVASKRLLPLKEIVHRYGRDTPIWWLDEGQKERLRRQVRRLVLTDNYAPVENLLAPVVRDSAILKHLDGFEQAAAALTAQCRYAQAREEYQNMLDTYPATAVYACNGLAALYGREGLYEKAVTAFRQALTANDQRGGIYDTTYIHLNLGRTLRQMGRREEAEQHLQKAQQGLEHLIQGNPFAVGDIYLLGELKADERQWSAATDYFRGALELKPDNGSIRLGLAGALAAQGRRAEAAQVLREGVQLLSGKAKNEQIAPLRNLLAELEAQQNPTPSPRL